MTTKTVFATLAALTLAATQAHAASPSFVRIRALSYAGSGCPAGSVSTYVSAERNALSIDFDAFVAETGPGVSTTERRKNCTMNIDLAVPYGWQYAVSSVDYGGFAALDPGVTARLDTKIYFSGAMTGATGALSTTLLGPKHKSFRIHAAFGAGDLVWSACGAPRALNLSLQATLPPSRTGDGLISLHSPFDLGHGIRLVFRRC